MGFFSEYRSARRGTDADNNKCFFSEYRSAAVMYDSSLGEVHGPRSLQMVGDGL